MHKTVYLLIALSFVVGITIGTSTNVIAQQASIPNWVKKTALWWGEGQVSDADFLKALQFLIDQGYLKVSFNTTPTPPTPQTSNTAPSTPSSIPSNQQQPSSSQSSNSNIITNSNFLPVQNNPDAYANQWAKLTGTFTQDPYVDNNGLTWAAFNYAQGDTIDPNKELWFSSTNSSLNIKANDCAIVEGHIIGTATFQYKLTGATEQVPEINLEKITMISCLEAKYPAINTINVGQSQTQGNIKVTIDEIEFSQYHTRIFAKVQNIGNPSGIDFDGGTIVQGQTQYDSTYGPFGISENRLNFVTNIQNGVVEDGVLFFDPIQNQPFKLMLKGTEGGSFSEDDFVFNISP